MVRLKIVQYNFIGGKKIEIHGYGFYWQGFTTCSQNVTEYPEIMAIDERSMKNLGKEKAWGNQGERERER